MFRDYNKYDVLPSGKIWSKVSNKFLKPTTLPNGYQKVCLVDNEGKHHQELVHRVCWMAVNGLWNLPDGYELDHIDENKKNNHISNLRLCTHKENCNFGTRNERVAKALGKRVGAFKNGVLQMVFASTQEAQRAGYNSWHVSDCCRGERKTHKGFEWRYLDN